MPCSPRALCLLFALAPLRLEAAEATIVEVEGVETTILIDGELAGAAPLTLEELSGGRHELSLKATRFGPILFTEAVEVPRDGEVTITVNLAERTLMVELGRPQVKPAEASTAPASEALTAAVAAELPVASAPETGAAAAAEPDDADAAKTGDDAAAEAGEDRSAPVSNAVGGLFVGTEPAGARIVLDGVDTGLLTPSLLEGVAVGPHQIRVQTDCAWAEGAVELREDLIERLELVLEPGTGDLQISTTPPAVRVIVDGDELGVAPLLLEAVDCGTHAVILRAPGYLESRHSLQVPAFEVTNLDVDMEAEQYGTLVIAVHPLEAAIALDGIAAGHGPMTLEGVGAGEHTLDAALDGYAPHSQAVVVAPDAVTRLDIALDTAPTRDVDWSKLVLNTSVTAAGGILAVDALRHYQGARDRYQRYLDEPDDGLAEALYDAEVRPERRRAIVEGAGAVVLLSTGAVLWLRTDLAVTATSSGLTAHRYW